jgi:hypothetical protein
MTRPSVVTSHPFALASWEGESGSGIYFVILSVPQFDPSCSGPSCRGDPIWLAAGASRLAVPLEERILLDRCGDAHRAQVLAGLISRRSFVSSL